MGQLWFLRGENQHQLLNPRTRDNDHDSTPNYLDRDDDNDGVKVVRVIDGDTIVINYHGKKEKVRLIGVDTPEKYDSRKLLRNRK